MLTNEALQQLREFLKVKIAYAQYKVGGSYYRAEIASAELLADGRVTISLVIDHNPPGDITVSEVQLYDHSGRLWVRKTESIARKASQEGILYRFRFTIMEG